MNAVAISPYYDHRTQHITQCLKPCINCDMTVRVLISVRNETHGIASIVNEVMDECDIDDISVVFRVNGVDQAVKCKGRCGMNSDNDDCIF